MGNKKSSFIEIKKILCDVDGCGYEDTNVDLDNYKTFVNRKCPKCGSILLTEDAFKKFKSIQTSFDRLEELGHLPEKGIENIVKVNNDGRLTNIDGKEVIIKL